MDDNKLFVGGISWDTKEEGLKEAFSQFGEVEEAVIITDKMTGKSKGFAFVTMKNAEDAEKAIQEMNGKELDGRSLTVNKARPKRENTMR